MNIKLNLHDLILLIISIISYYYISRYNSKLKFIKTLLNVKISRRLFASKFKGKHEDLNYTIEFISKNHFIPLKFKMKITADIKLPVDFLIIKKGTDNSKINFFYQTFQTGNPLYDQVMVLKLKYKEHYKKIEKLIDYFYKLFINGPVEKIESDTYSLTLYVPITNAEEEITYSFINSLLQTLLEIKRKTN